MKIILQLLSSLESMNHSTSIFSRFRSGFLSLITYISFAIVLTFVIISCWFEFLAAFKGLVYNSQNRYEIELLVFGSAILISSFSLFFTLNYRRIQNEKKEKSLIRSNIDIQELLIQFAQGFASGFEKSNLTESNKPSSAEHSS